jgi:hypothetical protein
MSCREWGFAPLLNLQTEESKMENLTEQLALLLSFDEARKQLEPKGYWPPDADGTIEFAGRQLTREDLAELVFNKHQDLFLTEAAKILENRAPYLPLMSFNKETAVID